MMNDERKDEQPPLPYLPLPEPDLSRVSIGNPYSWIDGNSLANATKKISYLLMGERKKGNKREEISETLLKHWDAPCVSFERLSGNVH